MVSLNSLLPLALIVDLVAGQSAPNCCGVVAVPVPVLVPVQVRVVRRRRGGIVRRRVIIRGRRPGGGGNQEPDYSNEEVIPTK